MEPLSKKFDRWHDEETRELISTYESFVADKLFDGTVRDNQVYKRMVAVLSDFGIHKTVEQVKNKLKLLKKTYIRERNKLHVTGADEMHISFPFYQEMDRIYRSKDTTNPIIITDIVFKEKTSDEQSNPEEPAGDPPETVELRLQSPPRTPEREKPYTPLPRTSTPKRKREEIPTTYSIPVNSIPKTKMEEIPTTYLIPVNNIPKRKREEIQVNTVSRKVMRQVVNEKSQECDDSRKVVQQVVNEKPQDDSLEATMGAVIGKLLKRIPEPRKSRMFRNFINALCAETVH